MDERIRTAVGDGPAWVVGGAVRDRLLGRATDDVDIAVAGDPRGPANRIARASGGAAFQLSHEFGGWRAVGPGHAWQVDVLPLRDGDLAADLAARDFAPMLTRLHAVSSFGVPSTWTVSTDRGDTRFVLKAEEDIRRLEGGALLIASAQGLQFRVPDPKALDRASRKLLERFL